MYLLTKYLLT